MDEKKEEEEDHDPRSSKNVRVATAAMIVDDLIENVQDFLFSSAST